MMKKIKKWHNVRIVIYVLIYKLNIFSSRALTLEYTDLQFALIVALIQLYLYIRELSIQIQENLGNTKLTILGANLPMNLLQ